MDYLAEYLCLECAFAFCFVSAPCAARGACRRVHVVALEGLVQDERILNFELKSKNTLLCIYEETFHEFRKSATTVFDS